MAKAIYLGVDGKARKMKKAYIGIDGKAHKVKKVYVGVDGKAKLAYTDYVPVSGFSLSVSTRNDSTTHYKADEDTGSSAYTTGRSGATITASITPSNATDQTVTWSYSGSNSYSGLSVSVSPSGNICAVSGYYDSRNGAAPTTNKGGYLGTLTATLANGMTRSVNVSYTAASVKTGIAYSRIYAVRVS